MRPRLLILLSLLSFSALLPATEVVKRDGEVVNGEVTERVEGEHVRLRTDDGKVYVFYWDEIKSVDGQRLHGRRRLREMERVAPESFMDQTWFAYWALGAAWATYDADWNSYLSPVHGIGGMGLDLLGFYWPTPDRKSIVGFVANGTADVYIDGYGRRVQIDQYTYALSAWRSLQGELGDGAFLRLDIGPAKLGLTDGYDSRRYGYGVRGESDWGIGGGVGVGYLFGSNPENRISLTALYTPRYIGSTTYQSGNVNLGVLW